MLTKRSNFANAARGNQILLKIWRRGGGLAGTLYLSVDNTNGWEIGRWFFITGKILTKSP